MYEADIQVCQKEKVMAKIKEDVIVSYHSPETRRHRSYIMWSGCLTLIAWGVRGSGVR